MTHLYRPIVAVLVALAFSFPLGSASAYAATPKGTVRSVVFFHSEPLIEPWMQGTNRAQRIVAQFGVKSLLTSQRSTFAVIEADAQTLSAMRKDPRIAAVIPDFRVQATVEEEPASSWGLDRIDQSALPLDGSFHTLSDGDGVDMYVLDTGVDADHPEFGQRVLPGVDFTGNRPFGDFDPHGHGTHVAGTAAGSTFGIAREATIIPVRVLNAAGSGAFSWVLAGMEWVISEAAARQRPAVANMSLGADMTYATNREEIRAITNEIVDRAASVGVTFVLAAGNNSGNACYFFPAFASTALTVGATAEDDTRAWYSNSGSCVDLYAPGSNIRSARTSDAPFGGGSVVFSGTSMAAPHVAGAVAIHRGAEQLLSVTAMNTLVIQKAVLLAGVGWLLNLQRLGCRGAPCLDRPPWLSADVRVGSRIYPQLGVWLQSNSQRFVQWYQCDVGGAASMSVPEECDLVGAPIAPGTGSSLVLTSAFYRKYIRVAEVAVGTNGEAFAVSASTGMVKTLGATQEPLTLTPLPSEIRFGSVSLVSLDVTGGSGDGEIIWSGTHGVCEILHADVLPRTPTLQITGAGPCNVTVRKLEDASYATAQTEATVSVMNTPAEAPAIIGTWEISGTPVVGSDFAVDLPTVTGWPTPVNTEYRWWRCRSAQSSVVTQKTSNGCTLIAGATRSVYRPITTDLGFRLRFGVRSSNSAGTVWFQSATSTQVVATLGLLDGPKVSGRTAVGQRLTASIGQISGTPPSSIGYQWYSCAATSPRGVTPHPSCAAIPGAIGQRFMISVSELGRTILVRVTAINPVVVVERYSATTSIVR